MNKNFLPLGSIIKLNEDKRKLMVVAYKAKSKDNDEIFDYAGCLFPEGLMEDYYILFNKYDVSEVFFEGYKDEEYDDYMERISELTSHSSNPLTNSNMTPTEGKKGVKTNGRVPKAAKHPRSISEMKAKYSVEKISGNQTESLNTKR